MTPQVWHIAMPVAGCPSQHPMQLRLADYPQLKLIAWNRREDGRVDEEEALALYERNWRFIDEAALEQKERRLIERLVWQYGHGVLNV